MPHKKYTGKHAISGAAEKPKKQCPRTCNPKKLTEEVFNQCQHLLGKAGPTEVRKLMAEMEKRIAAEVGRHLLDIEAEKDEKAKMATFGPAKERMELTLDAPDGYAIQMGDGPSVGRVVLKLLKPGPECLSHILTMEQTCFEMHSLDKVDDKVVVCIGFSRDKIVTGGRAKSDCVYVCVQIRADGIKEFEKPTICNPAATSLAIMSHDSLTWKVRDPERQSDPRNEGFRWKFALCPMIPIIVDYKKDKSSGASEPTEKMCKEKGKEYIDTWINRYLKGIKREKKKEK